MKIAFMGIQLPALSQNGPTELVVCIFSGRSTRPVVYSSITQFFLGVALTQSMAFRGQCQSSRVVLKLLEAFPPLPLCLQSLFCKLSCCLKILLDLIDWTIQKSIRLFVTQSFAFLWAIPIVYSSIESIVSFDSLPVCNVRC